MPLLLIILLITSADCFGYTRLNITGSQSISEDWRQGEKRNLQFNTSVDHRSYFHIDTLKVDIEFRFMLGYLMEDFNDSKESFLYPTANNIYGQLMLSYPLGWRMDPYVSVNTTTQPVVSYRQLEERFMRTAKFWDPVTIRESMGFAYSYRKERNMINTSIGLSFQQIRADMHYQLTDDYKTKDLIERYKTESGISLKNDMMLQLSEKISYRNSVDLFTTFDEPDKWAVKFENQFSIKIWKIFGIAIDCNIYYDDNQMASLQYGQNTQLGIVSMF